MKYYAVAEMDVTEPGWARDYVANVTGMVERHGGRYLARTAGSRRSRASARAAAVPDHRVALERGRGRVL